MDQHQDNAPAPAPPISGAGATIEQMTANEMHEAAKASQRRGGRPRGSRSSDTVALLRRLAEYQELGVELTDALASIADDRAMPWAMRLAACRHLAGMMLGRLGSPPG